MPASDGVLPVVVGEAAAERVGEKDVHLGEQRRRRLVGRHHLDLHRPSVLAQATRTTATDSPGRVTSPPAETETSADASTTSVAGRSRGTDCSAPARLQTTRSPPRSTTTQRADGSYGTCTRSSRGSASSGVA